MTKLCAVVTTIQAPTTAMRGLGETVGDAGGVLVVVADRKSPLVYDLPGSEYLSVAMQNTTRSTLAERLPFNHYARKNLGYLHAMARGYSPIFDTDDDNVPTPGWRARPLRIWARACGANGWVNAYQWFSSEQIWPRGFPLELIRASEDVCSSLGPSVEVEAPIQQGLANGSPDVDAVWRLVSDRDFRFDFAESVLLQSGAWCPFNSQCTWWFPRAYPLLYLPSLVSFRMTDIWRSFVAQRCLWELGFGVVFHGPEVFQDRNPHNLLRDFEQEVPGYLGNARLCKVLETTQLSSDPSAVGDNLHRCYERLVDNGFVPAEEMSMVEAWLSEIRHT